MGIQKLIANRNTNLLFTLICLTQIALGISMLLVGLRIVGLVLIPLGFPPFCVGVRWTIFWHLEIRSERRRTSE